MASGLGNDRSPETRVHPPAQPANQGGDSNPESRPYQLATQPAYPTGVTADSFSYQYHNPAGSSNAHPHPYPYASPYYNADQAGRAAYYGGPPPASRRTFFGCFFTAVIVFFLLSSAGALILSLIVSPRIPDFSVSSAAVSSFDLASQQLSSDFNITMAVLNSNEKMVVHYDRLDAAVLYGSDILSETSLPPFEQTVGEATSLNVGMVAEAKYVDEDVADGIQGERRGGSVGFDMEIVALVRFTAGQWIRSGPRMMKVLCGDIRIRFGSAEAATGSMVGPQKRCLVEF